MLKLLHGPFEIDTANYFYIDMDPRGLRMEQEIAHEQTTSYR